MNDTRPMKWHIFNEFGEPLTWEEEAFEFDTEEAAKDFLQSGLESAYEDEIEFWKGAIIKECILYYDGGYIDGTNLLITLDENTSEEILINKL